MADDLELDRDPTGNIQPDEKHMTSVAGVFVAGGMHQGQSLVVKAIAEGRKAAMGIIDYLKLNRRKPERSEAQRLPG